MAFKNMQVDDNGFHPSPSPRLRDAVGSLWDGEKNPLTDVAWCNS